MLLSAGSHSSGVDLTIPVIIRSTQISSVSTFITGAVVILLRSNTQQWSTNKHRADVFRQDAEAPQGV